MAFYIQCRLYTCEAFSQTVVITVRNFCLPLCLVGELHARFLLGDLTERHRLEDLILSVSSGHTIKLKVKVTLEQATKAQKGSRGIALLFL